jgi:NlpC/P60 family protein
MSDPTGDAIVAYAKTALGVAYRWGGNSMSSGIDCSGLVQQVYQHFGISLPRVTYNQIGTGAAVAMKNLRPGDLVFFDTDAKRSGPDHVGIYIGGGKFIHAPHTGDVVKISSLSDSYYTNRWMGGRRISGVVTSADYDPSATQAPEVKLSKSELAETYGMSYAFFKSQPELMKKLTEATKGQWTADRFTAELKNTKWWKDNSESMRQAQVMARTDPATYRANLAAAEAAASKAAVQMGAVLSIKQLQKLAKNMVTFQWNDAQVANYMGQYVKFNEDHVLGGQAGAAAQAIEKYSYDNGIPSSDETNKTQAAYLMRGLTSMEKIQDSIRQQAIGAYPAFADQIAAGATVKDVAQPYIQMVADELGLPDTDVDVWHPKVRAAIQGKDAAGAPAAMSLTDFRTALRDDPQWRKTDSAVNTTMAIGRQVLSDLGLVR